MLEKVPYFSVMQTTRVYLFKSSHRQVKKWAKRMNLSLSEAYAELANFGMDALERQKTLLMETIRKSALHQEASGSESPEGDCDSLPFSSVYETATKNKTKEN